MARVHMFKKHKDILLTEDSSIINETINELNKNENAILTKVLTETNENVVALSTEEESTSNECMDQAAALQLLGLAQQSPQPKRGAWTKEEDELLLSGIRKFGYGKWKEIATVIPGRKGKQLKQRWDNTLAAKYVDQKWLKNKIQESKEQKPLFDWSTLVQKVSEKLKVTDQTSVENLISQLLSNDSSLLLLSQLQRPVNSDTEVSSEIRKRKRSDPAIANTQQDAMSIYASSSPVTTTIDNQTQTFYPCLYPDCGKKFTRLYNLKSHSRTHTDDRPFICQVCHIAFSRNHDLKRHVKIHGGDKPFQCSGCNKNFSRLDALKRHKSNQRNKTACVDSS